MVLEFLILFSSSRPRELKHLVSADFAEVDILEEADKSDEDALKFNLDWMVKVIYTIKPSDQ